MGEVTVFVEQPMDWVGSVVVPVLAVFVATAISLLVARSERKSAERDRVATHGASIIRTLGATMRAANFGDVPGLIQANARFQEEVNAFAAMLPRKDAAVAKYVAVVALMSDGRSLEDQSRTSIFLSAALELWLRGELKTRDFRDNMPSDTSAWSEQVDLGQWDAVLRGQPAMGVPDPS